MSLRSLDLNSSCCQVILPLNFDSYTADKTRSCYRSYVSPSKSPARSIIFDHPLCTGANKRMEPRTPIRNHQYIREDSKDFQVGPCMMRLHYNPTHWGWCLRVKLVELVEYGVIHANGTLEAEDFWRRKCALSSLKTSSQALN